ncbi:MAG: CHRD domain-containing protein [Actinobacteria bacterium]|nr:CHRD domain-containing protein [Actinomycetota bacterium]MBW3642979.1 CHRD domain-containing protein [Actinomycetota bacterium]
MTRHPFLTVGVLGAALVLGACGAGQDPALEAPESTSTTAAGDATGTPSGGVTEEVVLENITLTGAAEVPGPGDDDGDGFANVFLQPADGQICYDINVEGIDPASAAHIHEGGPDVAGPVVVPLQAPSEGSIDDCAQVDVALIERIEADPSGFYVNVHNASHPDGALRGQLASG